MKKNNKKDRQLVEQDLSPKEKKAIGIIGLIALALIVVVIVVTVVLGQDKNVIKNAYGLEKHIFEYTTLEEVQEMKSSKQEFHLVIVRKPTSTESQTSLFVNIVNDKAKELEISKIYLLEIETYTQDQRRQLVNILGNGLTYESFFNSSNSIPTLVYFNRNKTGEISSLGNHSNNSEQIEEYFNNYKDSISING